MNFFSIKIVKTKEFRKNTVMQQKEMKYRNIKLKTETKNYGKNSRNGVEIGMGKRE